MFTKRGPRVEAETAALAAAGHPGVVELVHASGDVLRTRLVEGTVLAQAGPLAPEEVAGLAAALATTLADLHDKGVVHGGVEAAHVIVAADGRPVLCSLGRGGEPPDDVAALGRLVTSLLATAPAADPVRTRLQRGRHRLGTMLAPPAAPALAALAAAATDDDADRRPTARALATAIRERVPTARLPRARAIAPARPAGGRVPSPLLRWPAAVVAGSAAVALALGLAWWAIAASDPPHPSPPPSRQPPAPPWTTAGGPAATRVWPAEPVDVGDGVVTFRGARYAIGLTPDAAVAGDWDCTGRPTLALLHDGRVLAFDAWAEEGRDVAARVVGQVPQATGLRAVDVDGDGCHDLEVVTAAGPPVRVEVLP